MKEKEPEKMEKIPDEIESYIQAAAAKPAMEESAIFDEVMDCLLGFKKRMARAKDLLTYEALTAFFFVTLPETLPIARHAV